MTWKFLFWCVVLYFLYRFIVRVVLPVSKVASDMKTKIKEMQEAQQQHQHQYNQETTTNFSPKPEEAKTTTTKAGDYIDFEEVK